MGHNGASVRWRAREPAVEVDQTTDPGLRSGEIDPTPAGQRDLVAVWRADDAAQPALISNRSGVGDGQVAGLEHLDDLGVNRSVALEVAHKFEYLLRRGGDRDRGCRRNGHRMLTIVISR